MKSLFRGRGNRLCSGGKGYKLQVLSSAPEFKLLGSLRPSPINQKDANLYNR